MLEQIDQESLLVIINDYISNSVLYQQKYKNITINNCLNLPFLTKHELLEDQEKFPPFGSNLCVDKCEINRIHKTSGTTNRPLLIAQTLNDINIVTDIGSKLFRLVGMDENKIIINCLNYNMWMGGYTDHQSMEKTGAAVIPFGVGNTDSLISLIKDLGQCSIHCTPSYLGIIKKKLLKDGVLPKELNIENGYFGAEGGLQNKDYRNKIEQEWNINAYNANYGISEVISILGSECKNKDGLHFGALDVLFVELIDENLGSVDIIVGAKGELVITHLKKEAQPLIRYRTGDVIEIISISDCDCGFKGFKFKVNGRIDDMIVIKGVNFFPESIRKIINKHDELTGVYKVIVSKNEPIEWVRLIVETKADKLVDGDVKSDLLKKIKSNLNISVELVFTKQMEFIGNKIKIVERI